MNISRNPELLDRLAASYALGTLRGGARRRFETLAREHATVRAAALVWQGHWSGLAELQNQAQPAPAVWTRIYNLVRADVAAQAAQAARELPAASGGWLRSLLLWRGAAALGALATVTAVVIGLQAHKGLQATAGAEVAQLRQQLQATPQIQYVAVLADDKASASMLVTFDPNTKKLMLKRVGDFREQPDKSLELWALPPGAPAKSLGVLSADAVVQMTAADTDIQRSPALAITLEPKGGVPPGTAATGPILFKGALIKTEM